jgi:hypothetical protein
MEGEGFNIFGDPDELRERLGDLAEQMQGAQRVAWADNAIKLAVDMTVAAINRSGSSFPRPSPWCARRARGFRKRRRPGVPGARRARAPPTHRNSYVLVGDS